MCFWHKIESFSHEMTKFFSNNEGGIGHITIFDLYFQVKEERNQKFMLEMCFWPKMHHFHPKKEVFCAHPSEISLMGVGCAQHMPKRQA